MFSEDLNSLQKVITTRLLYALPDSIQIFTDCRYYDNLIKLKKYKTVPFTITEKSWGRLQLLLTPETLIAYQPVRYGV